MSHHNFHIKQARHNTDFYKKIDKLPFLDWMTTVIFYIAVQYVDFFLSQSLGQHPIDHKDRNRIIQTNVSNGRLFSQNFWNSYSRLYNDSKMARYEPDKWINRITPSRISLYLRDLDIIKNRR